jgi:hypothetical protein
MLVALSAFLICGAVKNTAGTFPTRYADALARLMGFGGIPAGSALLAAANHQPPI